MPNTQQNRAWFYAILAHVLWGFFPLYFAHLKYVSALEVIIFRSLFALIACALLLLGLKRLASLALVCRNRRQLLGLSLAGFLIITNWTTYVYAVQTERIVDASLGYFITPIVTVLLGVVILRERLTLIQTLSVSLGVLAVAYLVWSLGSLPWISLVLASSFALYSLVKKQLAAQVPAITGMVIENAAVMPLLLGYWGYLFATQNSIFQNLTPHTPSAPATWLWLIGAGVITAIPLILFARAARGLPLGVVGLIQYISPIMQMLIGILVFQEQMPPARWIGTAIVWIALTLITIEGLVKLRKPRHPSS